MEFIYNKCWKIKKTERVSEHWLAYTSARKATEINKTTKKGGNVNDAAATRPGRTERVCTIVRGITAGNEVARAQNVATRHAKSQHRCIIILAKWCISLTREMEIVNFNGWVAYLQFCFPKMTLSVSGKLRVCSSSLRLINLYYNFL